MARRTLGDIREALLGQLKVNGTEGATFEDQVEDYLELWRVKEALRKDIKKRGVTYADLSSVGVPIQKNNPSTKELAMVNRQMLSLLRELGLAAGNSFGGGDDDPL